MMPDPNDSSGILSPILRAAWPYVAILGGFALGSVCVGLGWLLAASTGVCG